MKWSSKVIKWLRIIHRDLGYLLVGLTLVYGISGYLLNHLDGKNPAYKTVYNTVKLQGDLDSESLKTEWTNHSDLPKVNKVLPLQNGGYRVFFDGGIGTYNAQNGVVSYEIHKRRTLIYYINKFHYNKVDGWTFTADFFAFALIFFAISGMFMVRGKNSLAGRGKWYVIIGIIIPILYVLFTK